jgi:hypothetical protein
MLPTPRSVAIFLGLLCGVAASYSQAPSDQVFLTERFLLKTHSTLRAFPTGTALRVVSENGDTSHVTHGTATFDVPNNKLTKDADLAARLAQNEHAAEEAALAQQMDAYQQAEAAKRAEQERQAEQQRQAEIQRQQAAQWQAQQQPEIPWALQAVQAIQAEQTRQTELQQAEQQRQAEIAQLALQAQYWQKARAAEQRASELESHLNQVRADERFEFNKAADEGGNQATYYVEEAFDWKIRNLQGKIEDSRQEKNAWQQRAWQAEQH